MVGMGAGADLNYSADALVHRTAKAASSAAAVPGGAASGTDRLWSSGAHGCTAANPRAWV